MVDFSIVAYGENLRTEQSVPINTMLMAHNLIMAQFSNKVTPKTNFVFTL